jgi:cell volume regulation protein A
MTDTGPFAHLLLVVSLAAIAAVLSNRFSTWVRIPAPVVFFTAAAVGGRRLRPAIGPVLVVGVLGTFLGTSAVSGSSSRRR